MFHPAIPYVTEELWSELVGEGFIATAEWPEPPVIVEPAGFDNLRSLIVGIRRFRAEHGLSPRADLAVCLFDPEGIAGGWWIDQFTSLASVTPAPIAAPPTDGPYTRIVAESVEVFVALEGIVDLGHERARLGKAIAGIQADLVRSEGKLDNPDFVRKAPEAVVEKERDKADVARARMKKLQVQLKELD